MCIKGERQVSAFLRQRVCHLCYYPSFNYRSLFAFSPKFVSGHAFFWHHSESSFLPKSTLTTLRCKSYGLNLELLSSIPFTFNQSQFGYLCVPISWFITNRPDPNRTDGGSIWKACLCLGDRKCASLL